MIYIAKCSGIAAAIDLAAAWEAEHAEYYGSPGGSGHKGVPLDFAGQGIDLIPWWWPMKGHVAPRGVICLAAEVTPPGALAQLGYTTDGGRRHQWLRSSGTVAQIDIGRANVTLTLSGKRHSVQEMARTYEPLWRLYASVFETLAYKTREPTWGPLDTADRPWG